MIYSLKWESNLLSLESARLLSRTLLTFLFGFHQLVRLLVILLAKSKILSTISDLVCLILLSHSYHFLSPFVLQYGIRTGSGKFSQFGYIRGSSLEA